MMTFLGTLLPLALAAASPGAETGRGLWIGDIELCRETVAQARLIPDPIDGRRSLYVALRPALWPAFARETAARIEQPLPIRLDGRLLSAPIVREPITGGHLQIGGLRGDVAAARRAALRPCRHRWRTR